MFTDNNLYISQFQNIIRSGVAKISNIKPSDWVEERVVMGKPRPGPFRYDYTPYAREIIDCLAPDHPARKVAVMKGAQIGFSSGVIIPGIGWMIENNPGNCYLMVGAADLVPKAMDKLDLMIDSAQLANFIRSQSVRRKSAKTGDTNEKKEFAGGYVSVGSANNHKAIAQVDLQYIFLDDFDAMKGQSNASGALLDLIEMRSAAYASSYKLFMISTPLLSETSNIQPAFLNGDQRRYHVECPCCHEPIIFKWDVKEGDVMNPKTNEVAVNDGGIKWEVNNHGQLIESKVVYVCYKCGGAFTDKNKQQQLQGGIWIPTAIPIKDDYFSYHIPSLYAPVGMYNWAYYANKYIEANPENKPRVEKSYQTLVNTCFGETYNPPTQSLKATTIMANGGRYKAGIVPEALSIRDGNGKIVMLTCGADLNGVMAGHRDSKEDDGRLDYEVVAHSESGATYSVYHGSIGTFVPRETSAEKDATDRVKWTYGAAAKNNIWLEFEKILTQHWPLDVEGGGAMRIAACGLDCGYLKDYAYTFIGQSNCYILGLKGEKDDELIKWGVDVGRYKPMHHRNDAYVLQSNMYKDMLSDYMNLKWNKSGDSQPYGFMNFPASEMGLYQYDNYYSHFEAEERKKIEKSDGTIYFGWAKKNFSVQNHLFDCRLYNLAILDIYMKDVCWKQAKLKDPTWADFCNVWKALRMY